jgi:hypothetical protein
VLHVRDPWANVRRESWVPSEPAGAQRRKKTQKADPKKKKALDNYRHRVDGLHVVAYDSERVVRALMDKHGLNEADAREWYEFNTTGAYVGTGTPVFIRLCEQVV